MNWFKIDYYKLVRLLLPIILRQPIVIAFLESAVSPVDMLHILFSNNRDDNLYRLSITPQVCYLEKALNDRFDVGDRRIYIGDGVFYEELFLYTDAENKDEFIYAETENKNMYIYTGSETGSESVDFIVNVPADLKYNEPEMKAIIDMYKLASKKYSINKYNHA
jgi:hypothetical protein